MMRTGYDMSAVLALGRAKGVPSAAIGEFFPMIEQIAVRRWTGGGTDDGT
ncbi:hypothetical protein AAD018_011515 [Aestuariibius insulae]